MQLHILLVEDQPDQLDSMALRLEGHLGCKIIKANNLEVGIDSFNKFMTTLDLVITDMHLGAKNPKGGLDMVKHIANKSFDYIPVIVLTAYAEVDNAADCMEAGAFSYVQKGDPNDTTFRKLCLTILRALEYRNSRLQVNGMASAICAMVDSHEPYTGGHSKRVGGYARIVATKRGLSVAEQMIVWQAGLVHDLAKVGIGADVLARPAKLSTLLMASIEAHPTEGYEMLKRVNANPAVAQAVLEHHKRIDGTGYPKDLTYKPSLVGQIVGLVDSFDAMTTPRPYMGGRGRDTFTAALNLLQNDASNGMYDPTLVNCLNSGIQEIWDIFKSHVAKGWLPRELLDRNKADGRLS